MNIEKFKEFILKNKTNTEKEIICSTLSGRLCHHKVRFLNYLINYMEGTIKSYLEIGVHNGCSMAYILQSNYKVDKCYGIDLFENSFYNDNLNKNIIFENLQKLNKNKNNIYLITGNSNDNETITKINNIKFDLIFIDGDHSYEGIKNDFHNYINLLSNNGIMVFDDFNNAPTNKGVYKFINELISNKDTYFTNYYKFIDNEHTHSSYNDGIIMFYK